MYNVNNININITEYYFCEPNTKQKTNCEKKNI